jgi:HK97 gp10 family phage protein
MPKGWNIEVLNLNEAVRAYKGVEEAFGATPLKECLMPIAKRVRDYAKGLVRVGPSPEGAHLRDNIFAAPGKEGLASVIVGVDRKKAPHAHLVEFGHGGKHPAPPRPFLRPALAAVRSAAKQVMSSEINDRIIKKLSRKYLRESEALARAARRNSPFR